MEAVIDARRGQATTQFSNFAPLNIVTAIPLSYLETYRNKKSQILINRIWLRRRVMKS